MQARFTYARWIAVLIIVVGLVGLIAWILQNSSPNGVFSFVPQQVLILSILWIVVGVLLWLFARPGDEPTVDPGAVTKLESRVQSFDSRFKDIDARLDARVADVDNRFSKRVGDFDSRLKTLESVPPKAESLDDLKIIEGIGPRIEQALKAAHIDTFRKLANASEPELQAALETAGLKFAPSISTWAQQAKYIVDGDMEGFEAYVAKLTGGRE